MAIVHGNIVLQDKKKSGHIVMTDDNIVWKGNLFDDHQCADTHTVEHVWAYPPHHHQQHHFGYEHYPHMMNHQHHHHQPNHGWSGHQDHMAAAASNVWTHAQPFIAVAPASLVSAAPVARVHSPFSLMNHQITRAYQPTKTGAVAQNRLIAENAVYPLLTTLFPSVYPISAQHQVTQTTNSKAKPATGGTTGNPNQRKASEEADDDLAEKLITQQLMQELGQELIS